VYSEGTDILFLPDPKGFMEMTHFSQFTVRGQRTSLLALTALAVLGVSAPAAQAQDAYSQAVLAANPLAYFQLGSVNQPSAVNGFTTTFNGSASVTAPGGGAPIASNPGNAGASFNGTPNPNGFGSGPSITTSLGSANATGASTLLGWFSLAQTPGTAGTSGTYYIAGRSQFGNDLDLQIQGDNRLHFFANGGGEVNAALPAFAFNKYYFFAASEDPLTQVSSLYINGALAATSTGDVSRSLHTSAFTIGDSSVFNPRNFDGSIDDVAFYDYALTSDQVKGIYASANTPGATPPVPEASTTVSLGLLLMLAGMAAVVRRKRGPKYSA